MMGIDRINSMLSQFGYGKPTGIDLGEEYNGLLPSREWKQKVHKKPGIREIPFRLASARILDCHADPDGKSHGRAD